MKRIFTILYSNLILLFACGQTQSNPAKIYSDKHTEALSYCKANHFSTEYYFLIDLSLPSGKNRFFVYEFDTQTILNQGLVTHGSCDVQTENPTKWDKASFSNSNNSHCSSLGKYKVGKRDYSSWGIHVKYWLDGLEKTNSNARKRVVVLHSWSAVPNNEIYPQNAPLSWGCPAVSDSFMEWLDAKLQETSKPVLLWIIQ